MSEIPADWGAAFSIEYYWQETWPDYQNSGQGVIHYDFERQCYALYNRFANEDRELGYILHAGRQLSYVFETRAGQTRCTIHPTDRPVFPRDMLQVAEDKGSGLVLGEPVQLRYYAEPHDHDSWLWCLNSRQLPLRFYTWTHHGKIQILHDLIALHADRRPDPSVFELPAGLECRGRDPA